MVGIQVNLMEQVAWLAEHLAEALDRVFIALKTHEDHATVGVVSEDLERVHSRQHRSDGVIDHTLRMLQASSLQAKQSELRVQSSDLLLCALQDVDGPLHGNDTVHGLSSANQDICKVTRNNLDLAGKLPAVLVEEFELEDSQRRLESQLELLLRLWLTGHALGEVEAQIQVRVGHDVHDLHGLEKISLALGKLKVPDK